MAQFDVHRNRVGGGLLLDCQSDLLGHFNTRFVVPLMPPDEAPVPGHRLNPCFQIDGKSYVMVTQYASAIEQRQLGPAIASLTDHDREVINALDVLITGV